MYILELYIKYFLDIFNNMELTNLLLKLCLIFVLLKNMEFKINKEINKWKYKTNSSSSASCQKN